MNENTNILDNPLLELLKVNNVKKINSLEELNQIYDVEKSLKDVLQINNNSNNIIIFDTSVYNSCYVIDLFNAYLNNTYTTLENVFERLQIYTFRSVKIF